MGEMVVIRYEEGSRCEVSIYQYGTVLKFCVPCYLLSEKIDEVVFMGGWSNHIVLRYYTYGRECDFVEEIELWLSRPEVEYEDLRKSLGDILRKYTVERVEVRANEMECVAKRERAEVPESLKSLLRLPF